MKRCAGVLLAVSSLPSKYGIGDFGKEAYRFIDDLNKANFKIWQILPLTPLGLGNSPYQPYSSKAMDPIYISLDFLKEEGLLNEVETLNENADRVDFIKVREFKYKKIEEAYQIFLQKGDFEAFKNWKANNEWAFNYAVYLSFKKENGTKIWSEWPKKQFNWIKDKKYNIEYLNEQINFDVWTQFVLFTQWFKLKEYANSKDIRIMGDIPFYVGFDSFDCWENQKCFLLDKNKRPTHIAGVPPDYFSETGQRWGNPIYDWKYLKKTNFDFWMDRIGFNAKIYDIIRIDHFRAFDTYWKIPASCPTAIDGEWCQGLGYELFDELYKNFKEIEIVAEDLGELFDSVLVLRDHFNLPGMNVLQFSFEPFNPVYGEKDRENQIIYSGTHDNETINGWVERMDDNQRNAVRRKLDSIGCSYPDFAYSFVRLALNNKANYCIVPMQDICSLTNYSRMNEPGTVGSPNWEFKMVDFTDFENRLSYLSELINNSGRNN